MAKKKILIIDDEEFIRELVIDFFESENVECFEADNFKNAGLKLKETKFDMVLLDWNLGRNKAQDLFGIIKKSQDNVPVVILTGDHRLERSTVGDAMVKDIIYKPFQIDDFMLKIKTYLEIR